MSEDNKSDLVEVVKDEGPREQRLNLLTLVTQNTKSEFSLTQDDEGVNAEFKSIFKLSKAISEYLNK